MTMPPCQELPEAEGEEAMTTCGRLVKIDATEIKQRRPK